jgi:CubicO group peptidase (beta-lactamase class C family)
MARYLSLLLFFFTVHAGFAQLKSAEIDALVNRTLKTFDVPGIAVAVIKDGKVVHSKGYGVRSLATGAPVTADTRFGIASNSKAFTAAALGLLMEEGKLTWDSKVTDFIPEFKMYDPYVTAEFTVRDLLTHRSGLGLGAGDLMFWPDENNFTKGDIIHNLRFLKPVSSFRTKYDYDNLLYIVAGEIVARASGKAWEDFIEERFFTPLGIQHSAASFHRLKDKENVIDPHFYVDGKLQVIRRDWSENANAAGGIYSSVNDMSKWVLALLDGGKIGDKVLLRPETLREVWTPQTLLRTGNPGPYNTQFSAYGLGWVINDVKGHKQLSHTGGLAGIVTQTVLIPDLKLGILVYTNQQSGAAFSAISNTIKDSYLGFKGQEDWVDFYQKRVAAAGDNAREILDKVQAEIDQKRTPPAIAIEGIYMDSWLGEAVIDKRGNQYWFTSKRSQRLTGPLYYYKGNTYVVRWTDRSMDADAFLVFQLDTEGNASGIRLNAISPLTDFSFDFQDLNFTKK